MMRSTPAAVLLFIVTAGGVSRLDAAFAIPVRVRFETSAPILLGNWVDRAPGVQRDLELKLSDRLKGLFPHWDFVPTDPPPGVPHAQLVFQVLEPTPDSLSLGVELRTPGSTVRLEPEKWRGASDVMILGVPPPDVAVEEITTAFVSRIFERREAELRQLLSTNVPLGVGAYWVSGGQARLVLGLPWTRHEALRESIFRLECDWPNQGKALLESVGSGLRMTYQPPSTDPPFDGLVVVASEREYLGVRKKVEQIDGSELLQLRPRVVFLKEYRPAAVDWLIGGRP